MDALLAKGFRLAVTSAGFKVPGRPDLALVVSDVPAAAAGVFTTNLFQAAPVQAGRERLERHGAASAILINTGQANACTGPMGLENVRLTQELAGAAAGIEPEAILPASTGVIGMQLKMDLWRAAVPSLAAGLGKAGVREFAEAMMTTDAFPKYASRALSLGGKDVVLTGMAKGAGMICPNMATMLAVVLCDAAVEEKPWRAMFRRAAALTFNRVTVDGDTSTNDTIYGLANGASGAAASGEAELALLEEALVSLLGELAYKLVQDGEGATKVMHIHVTGARNEEDAEKAARTVGHSQLVKTAMYGRDANWGRIVAALGRSGAVFTPEDVVVGLCGVELFRNGQPTEADFDALLQEPLEQRDLRLDISLGGGTGAYVLLASDLTHGYVDINADYRS